MLGAKVKKVNLSVLTYIHCLSSLVSLWSLTYTDKRPQPRHINFNVFSPS